MKMDKNKREKRGIYNVTFNDKKATPILKDIEAIENAAIEYIAMYIKGWHNIKRGKGKGAEHIKLHLREGSQGEITIEELVNIGHSLREYLKIFKEPYLEDENKTGKVYEWQDDKGVRFRVAVDTYKGEGLIPPLSPFADVIITFYSDRNLNEPMKFKNPKVEAYYQQQKALHNPTTNKKKVFSKNPKPTQETREKRTQKEKEISKKLKLDKDFSSKSNGRDR